MVESQIITDWNAWGAFAERLKPSKWVIFSDTNTTIHCLPKLQSFWKSNDAVAHLSMSAGESNKELKSVERIWQEMMDLQIDRDAVFICLGGGVVCDLGGYVASTYKRGIRSIYIPTTNLAMVDAAIGGKNGINLHGVKNQIGTFRNPSAIIIDTTFLNTLDQRQLLNGHAETIKHALISNVEFWNEIKGSGVSISKEVILRSMHIKQSIIEQDFGDKGPRQALNFGHTIGHAAEAASLHNGMSLLHGEAVAFGMIAESWLSNKTGSLSEAEHQEIVEYLTRQFAGIDLRKIDADSCIELMKQDKKNSGDKIICSLLDGIGRPRIGVEVSHSHLRNSLEFTLDQFRR